MLRGRIWGTPTSEPEQEEIDAPFGSSLSFAFPSSSPDLSLVDANADADIRPLRWNTNTNGHVRGMVDKWERESASSRSSSRSSSHRRSESDSRSEPGSDAGADTFPTAVTNRTVRPLPPLPFPRKDNAVVEVSGEEPSMEDLLAAESASPLPMDGSWGARAWEELDIGVTVRRVDIAHDTVVPRRDGSGSGSGSSSGIGTGGIGSVGSDGSRGNEGGGGSNNSSQRARRTVVDIFADSVDLDPSPALTADAGVQVDAGPTTAIEDGRAADVDAELQAKERALEDEVHGTRALLEEFRRRLEEVEARVGVMEVEWRTKEERQLQQQQQQRVSLDTHHDKEVEASEFFDDPTPPLPLSLPGVFTVPPTPTAETSASSDASCASDDADSERGVVRRGVGLGPETVSDLPSYVLLVGLGVCTVVLQVVLKRVVGRSLKP